jgi:quercetin dioxygenase-like cupin family protein
VFDALTALEQWREKGKAPAGILASKVTDDKVVRTRPLCPYPQVAQYKGSGSIDRAESFVCRTLGNASVASAQVPVTKEPRHQVVFENARLRVLNVTIPPGDTTLDHSHDHDIATVSMSGGADTRVQSPGQPWSQVRPRRPLGNAGATEYTGKPGRHRIENVGDSPYYLFAVENLRQGGWSTAAPLSAVATTPAIESRAFRAYDVRLVHGRTQTSHVHMVPTIAVLISGKVLSEGSDREAKANAPAPVGLKQLDERGQWVLIPQGESHHLVALGTGDSYVVELEIR